MLPKNKTQTQIIIKWLDYRYIFMSWLEFNIDEPPAEIELVAENKTKTSVDKEG